jgi:hypothetical protein
MRYHAALVMNYCCNSKELRHHAVRFRRSRDCLELPRVLGNGKLGQMDGILPKLAIGSIPLYVSARQSQVGRPSNPLWRMFLKRTAWPHTYKKRLCPCDGNSLLPLFFPPYLTSREAVEFQTLKMSLRASQYLSTTRVVVFCEPAHSVFHLSMCSEPFLHSDDPLVFTYCDVYKRGPYLNNLAGLLQVFGACTRYCLAHFHGRYHVRLNQCGCCGWLITEYHFFPVRS